MNNNPIKCLLKKTWFRDGSRHRILAGPMKGLYFRTNHLTRIAPIYSGPERDHQHLFAKILSPGDCVLDIGANWGSHTLYFARLVGPSGTVHAFEPLPEAMDELRWHVETNHLKNVTCHQLAVSNENGEATFFQGETTEKSHLDVVHSDEIQGKGPSTPVQVRTLDSVADELGLENVRLIKIDVEGAESLALAGAENMITRLRPDLIIDLHTPEQDLKVAAILDGWGYNLFRVSGERITRPDQPWPHPEGVWGTIHAVPQKKVCV